MIRLQWQAPGWRFFFKVLQKNFEKSISTVNIFIEYQSRAYDFACKKWKIYVISCKKTFKIFFFFSKSEKKNIVCLPLNSLKDVLFEIFVKIWLFFILFHPETQCSEFRLRAKPWSIQWFLFLICKNNFFAFIDYNWTFIELLNYKSFGESKTIFLKLCVVSIDMKTEKT